MSKAAERLDEIRTETSFASYGFKAEGVTDCGSAVLFDFDVAPAGRSKLSANEIAVALEEAGWTVTEKLYTTARSQDCPTLAQFLRAHPEGDFILVTGVNHEPHSMALRDGRLTDTDLTGGNRRRLNIAWRVERAA